MKAKWRSIANSAGGVLALSLATAVNAAPPEIVVPGFKYNMTDVQASLGLHQLQRQEMGLARREQIAAFYDAGFAELDGMVRTQWRPAPVRNGHWTMDNGHWTFNRWFAMTRRRTPCSARNWSPYYRVHKVS